MKKEIKNDSIIVCSSDIILSVKNFDLVESRIFYLSIYTYLNNILNEGYNKRSAVEINLSDVKNILNKRYTIDELADIIKNMKKSIRLNNVNNKYVKNGSGEIFWFDYYFLDKDSSKFIFKFTETFRECIEEIFNRFTILQLDEISVLKSKHSIRMYELYCQYGNQGNFKCSLDDLYEFFCPELYNEILDEKGAVIKKEKTLNTTDFLRSTINKAVKELYDKNGIKIFIEKVKKGKTLTHIIFRFEEKRESNKKEMFIVKQLKSAICHDNDNQQFKNEHSDNGDVIHKLPVDIDNLQELTDYIANL